MCVSVHMSSATMFRCLRTKEKSITTLQSRQSLKCKLNHLNSIERLNSVWILDAYGWKCPFLKINWNIRFYTWETIATWNRRFYTYRSVHSCILFSSHITLTQICSSNCSINVLDSFPNSCGNGASIDKKVQE